MLLTVFENFPYLVASDRSEKGQPVKTPRPPIKNATEAATFTASLTFQRSISIIFPQPLLLLFAGIHLGMRIILQPAIFDSFNFRSIDFNPNKQYQLATAGDDGAVRFWDIRQAANGPVAARTGDHSHWIWSVRYNAFHDQLILTSSSDGKE